MEKEQQKVKEREYIQTYTFGIGEISVQSGRTILTSKETLEEIDRFPFIDLSILDEGECKKVGEDLELDTKADRYTKLIFANIESLEVLERALAFCRKELEFKNDNH